jgi:anti-sigma regulatory factor (Ser/Thr protein kinase)
MTQNRLPEVLKSYLTFCDIRQEFSESGKLELEVDFIFPTTLLPLALLVSQSGASPHATNRSVQGYINRIMGAHEAPVEGTYIPFVRLPETPESCETVLSRLEDLSRTTKLFSENRTAYRYLVAELVDNIYQHARARRAYVMAQFYPGKGLMEASFIDDGVTIRGSLEKGTGIRYEPGSGYTPILDALSGKSAKSTHERGYGLGSSVRIANALGGEVMVVSGDGAVVATAEGKVLPFSLGAGRTMDGTLVSIRLTEADRKINIYELIE